MKLTKKLIKSYIPEEYYDGSNLDGISLITNSYDLFISEPGRNYWGPRTTKEFILRTSSDNPLIELLRKHFDVTYVKHFYIHQSEYRITISRDDKLNIILGNEKK